MSLNYCLNIKILNDWAFSSAKVFPSERSEGPPRESRNLASPIFFDIIEITF